MDILKFSVDFFIPVIMMILGGIFILNPPDKVNEHCGYRSDRSVKSTKAWIYANINLGKLWLGFGAITVVILSLLKAFTTFSPQIISLIGILMPVVLMFLSLEIVEEELKINFDKK